jgi:hypothetical protein
MRPSLIFDHLQPHHQELEVFFFERYLSLPSSYNYISWDIDLHDVFRNFDV